MLGGVINAKEIIVVTDEWEGYSNKDGTGYYFDLVRAVFTEPEYTVTIKHFPYKRTIFLTEANKADIVLGVYPENLTKSAVSKHPVEIDSVDVLLNKELSKSWNGLSSLEGKNVIARSGYGFDESLEVKVNYKEYPNLQAMLKMLAHGRVDAILDYHTDMDPLKEKAGIGPEFKLVKGVIVNKAYFGFSAAKEDIKNYYDKRFEELYKSGKISELMIKYNGSDALLPKLDLK